MRTVIGDAEAKKYVRLAIDIGAQMLAAGAEIERVEDSIRRICFAFGATKAQVIAMTPAIIVTVDGNGYEGVTEVQRVYEVHRNLELLTALNNVSREICSQPLYYDEVVAKIRDAQNTPTYGTRAMAAWYALVSAAFAIFFGGSYADCLVSGLVGAVLAPFEAMLARLKLNRFLLIAVCCFVAGCMAKVSVGCGFGDSTAMINIGNIMIYIPGVIFTTAIQEMFADNMVSAATRLLETLVISILIATGFVIAEVMF